VSGCGGVAQALSSLWGVGSSVPRSSYDTLPARDLELGAGPVEGAIENLMDKRMDHGGMRWIEERAEALLQLRCIDTNADWEAFTKFVHDETRAAAITTGQRIRLQQRQPSPLPAVLAEKAA
jgi:hypothetical protein